MRLNAAWRSWIKCLYEGIVHSDLSPSNMIITERGIAPIDFCLCGFGHYYMDLGSLYTHFPKPDKRQRMMEGYRESFPGEIETKYISRFLRFRFYCLSLLIMRKQPRRIGLSPRFFDGAGRLSFPWQRGNLF